MRILCLGDSIMQYNDGTTYPNTGWVQELGRFLPVGTEILNFARNGRSSKSFIAEGRFEKVLAAAREGDFALIGFAHNDEKSGDASRYSSPAPDGEFRRNLEYFVVNLWAKKCLPILLTPVARRKFLSPDGDGICRVENTHGDYPEAIRETAAKLGVPCIDLTRLTGELLEDSGVEKSKMFYMNFPAGLYVNYPDGKEDNSHLRPDGAFAVSRIAAMEMANLGNSFEEYRPLSDSIVGKKAKDAGGDVEIDDEYVVFQK